MGFHAKTDEAEFCFFYMLRQTWFICQAQPKRLTQLCRVSFDTVEDWILRHSLYSRALGNTCILQLLNETKNFPKYTKVQIS